MDEPRETTDMSVGPDQIYKKKDLVDVCVLIHHTQVREWMQATDDLSVSDVTTLSQEMVNKYETERSL